MYNNYGYGSYNQPTQQYAYVNGLDGAKAYQIMPNQSILLMDSNAPMFYFKISNSMGQCSIRTFKFEEVKDIPNPQPDVSQFALKEDVEEIKKMLGEMRKDN